MAEQPDIGELRRQFQQLVKQGKAANTNENFQRFSDSQRGTGDGDLTEPMMERVMEQSTMPMPQMPAGEAAPVTAVEKQELPPMPKRQQAKAFSGTKQPNGRQKQTGSALPAKFGDDAALENQAPAYPGRDTIPIDPVSAAIERTVTDNDTLAEGGYNAFADGNPLAGVKRAAQNTLSPSGGLPYALAGIPMARGALAMMASRASRVAPKPVNPNTAPGYSQPTEPGSAYVTNEMQGPLAIIQQMMKARQMPVRGAGGRMSRNPQAPGPSEPVRTQY